MHILDRDPFDFDEGASAFVERDHLDRPRIWTPCPDRFVDDVNTPGGCREGRIPGKRGERSVKCPKCKGEGRKLVPFARCTTFVSALEDTTAVSKWRSRIQLVGLALDWMTPPANSDSILDEILPWLDEDFDEKETRQALDAIAERAFLIGDRAEKAQRGTNLHALSEYADAGLDLPAAMPDRFGDLRAVTAQDRADMGAWLRIVEEFGLVFDSSECFVVNDKYRAAGTYDRRGHVTVTPDGKPFCELCDRPTIMDLKTGRVDYGAGKMSQQLAVYANASDYDPATGTRTPQEVCRHFGLIINLPQGTGEAKGYRVDLARGYEAVALSAQVREHRRASRHFIEAL